MEDGVHSAVSRATGSADNGPGQLFGRILRRRKRWIILGLVLGALAGLAYYALRGKEYESTAQILIIKKRLDTSPLSGTSPAGSPSEDYLSSHQLIIGSPKVVGEAVRNGNLAHLPSFVGRDDPIDQIINSLTVSRGSKRYGGNQTNILSLALRGGNPHDCRAVLNAIITSYQDFLKATYRNVNSETLELISRARDVLQKDLDTKEAAYREFRKTAPLLWRGKDGTTVHQDRLFALDGKRSLLRIRQAEIKAELESIDNALKQSKGKPGLLALAASSESNRNLLATAAIVAPEPGSAGKGTRSTLQEEAVNLQLEETRLLQTHGPDHPSVKAVRSRLGALSAMISSGAQGDQATAGANLPYEELINMRVQLLKRELQENTAIEASLANEFDRDQTEAKNSVLTALRDEAERQSIERSKTLYESIVKRLQEIDTMRDYGGFDTQVLAPADDGQWVIKNTLFMLGFTLFAGLLLGGGLACTFELLDRSFRSPQEIRERLGLPVLGHIPLLPRSQTSVGSATRPDPSLHCYHYPHSPQAEAYRLVRTALLFRANSTKNTIMQFTSPCRGDGKTTLAVNVAISLAHSGKKVLLIDGDFRRPRLHEVWGLPNDVGFTSVLSGSATFPEAIQPTVISSLSVLPSGPLPASPAELLSSGKLKEQLGSLRAVYDFILVDTPPLLSVTDPAVVASFMDAIILTVSVDKQSRPNAQRAQALLNSLGIGQKVLGVVVNRLRHSSTAYSDGYGRIAQPALFS